MKTSEEDADTGGQKKTAQIRRYFENIQEKELGLLENVYDAIKKNQTGLIVRLEMPLPTSLPLLNRNDVLITFFPLRMLDEYTFTHSTNVVSYPRAGNGIENRREPAP